MNCSMKTSVSDNISDPISSIPSLEELPVAERASKDMPGRPGNMPVKGVQGFGIIKHHPLPFDPVAEFDEAFAFYEEHGYVVVDQLSDDEILALNNVCDDFHPDYYSEFKTICDNYFFNHHRNEARGVGGLFFDYLKKDQDFSLEDRFDFVTAVGKSFLFIEFRAISTFASKKFVSFTFN